jgi:hypothetical protein
MLTLYTVDTAGVSALGSNHGVKMNSPANRVIMQATARIALAGCVAL